MTCDDIEWLVDLLGTIELLQYVISPPRQPYAVEDVSERGATRSAFRGGKVPDGLYFDGAHWYSVKGEKKTDSYTQKYQINGTAHFCQTFAAMIFMGVDKTELGAENYAPNIQAAMRFWIKLFNGDKELSKFFIQNIKTSKHVAQNPSLKNITHHQLIEFLELVAKNAHSLVNCKQG